MSGLDKLHFAPDARQQIDGAVIGSRLSEWCQDCIVRLCEDLKSDPMSMGEGQATDRTRRMRHGPFFVRYLVDETQRRVLVVGVRLI